MKKKTLFLRFILFGLVGFILFLVLLLLFAVTKNLNLGSSFWFWLGTFSAFCSAFISLLIIFYLFKILAAIDMNVFLSATGVKLVIIIRNLAFGECIILTGLMPMIYRIVDLEDAPGVLIIGIGIFLLVPVGIATFISISQSLLEKAVKLKSSKL